MAVVLSWRYPITSHLPDPGCEIWPVLRAVGAWEITIIHENIDRIIMGKPHEVSINPCK